MSVLVDRLADQPVRRGKEVPRVVVPVLALFLSVDASCLLSSRVQGRSQRQITKRELERFPISAGLATTL